ncbi:MAG: ABC transporter ATP-binding protein [Thermodesulfobacteriota bacterium]|jgi:putative ABC transport system ATP-binding protein
MTDPTPLIALEQISRIYSKGQCIALNEVSLLIEHQDYMAIMGPSGSGKSTLLHILCGLDHPSSGRIFFEGTEYLTRRQWARLRAERIGFVFQTFNLLPTLTAEENVEVPMLGVVRSDRERHQRSIELLTRVGMAGKLKHQPNKLSGGEKQRLAIARSLANSPDLVLADEPTGNLDSKTSLEILDLLEDIYSREGVTLVIVTHDREIASRVNRLVTINDGRIVSG